MPTPANTFALTIDDRLALIYSTFTPQGDILYVRSLKLLLEAVKLTDEEEQTVHLETLPGGNLK